MSERELKKMLRKSFEMEEGLYDFCIECLKALYPEDSANMIIRFDVGVEEFEYNDFIPGLSYLDSQFRKDKQLSEERKKEYERFSGEKTND